MKTIITKITAVLSLALALAQSAALAETGAAVPASAMSGFDLGYTLICVVALVSIIWLGVTTYRRTKYKAQ